MTFRSDLQQYGLNLTDRDLGNKWRGHQFLAGGRFESGS